MWMEISELISSPAFKTVVTGFSVVTPVLGIVWWLASRFSRERILGLKRDKASLENHLNEVQASLEHEKSSNQLLRKDREATKVDVVANEEQLAAARESQRRLMPYYQAYHRIKPRYEHLKALFLSERAMTGVLSQRVGATDQSLAELQIDLESRQLELDRSARRVRKALKLQGNLWAAKALQAVPKFRPLDIRKRAIISVLNLKGGVGKTTITAHLGTSLARRGYRVLLVDLDLQGSLTQMMIPYDKQSQLAADNRLVHHFMTKSAIDKTEKLLDYAQTIFEFPASGGMVGLISASDDLAYAELSLTLSWLLRHGERDNRFLLRKALHILGAYQQYDIVLLDCPPLVNISCINALSASDYLLTPVNLGSRATSRVPVLLKRFLNDERFRRHINHQLKVLGLVANRTYREDFTAAEREEWAQLGVLCRDVYGQDVKRFATSIPQLNREIRENETFFNPPPLNGKLAKIFDQLAAEIEQELPNECRRNATALS